jgi:transcription termination factor Rho
MNEPQLERSVLEAKDRDELMAIATALGASPGSRAKKADLITSILRATGIDVASDGATAGSSSAAGSSRAGAGGADAAETAGVATAADAAAAGAEGAAPSRRRTRTPRRPTAANGSTAEESPAADAAQVGDAIEAVQLGLDAAAAGPAGDEGSTTSVEGAGSGRPGAGSPNRGGFAGRGTSAVNTSGGRGSTGATGRNGASGGEQNRTGTGTEINGAADAVDHPDDLQGGRSGDGEPGNRRGRRRRGRDRFDRDRAERDLPGQAPEQQYSGEPIPVDGYLDLRDEGYGFLRTSGFLSGPGDVYVSISQVRRFALRRGDRIEGAARPAGGNEKYPALLRIDKVTGLTPDEARTRPRFESLTPLFPDTKLKLELPSHPANDTARIVDLIAPIGKGQRGLIVSPPKAGKTTVLKQIAHCIEVNNPDVTLMVLLVDERPEEVTDMARSVKGEVIASTFDRPAEEHIQVAELTIERAKRMVELGNDVVIILDGITRLARAYNLGAPPSGRIMSGGIDTGALYPPKKFFGAARNIEEGGSLTILATALVETGSRMDEVIFEEFKGTGNMELRLDRKLAERRIYPAIDVNQSSTRHEELLFDRNELQAVWKLRRVLNALAAEGSGAASLELLVDRLKSTKSNAEFLAEVAKTPTPTI